MPGRVLLQDFTGVPAVVDLAAMRDAMAALGGDPARINPLVPADLVIDHSVQVDASGGADAFAFNVDREYERNGERYQLLRWAQTAMRDFRVVPPGTGIVHQVNLEYLAPVVAVRTSGGPSVAFPDTLVGTDSHTTMISGLGVLGYGVGGIEAEAVLLGQPLYQPMPQVVGVRLHGELPRGSTATDLVLVISQMLRAYGVGRQVRRVRRRRPRVARARRSRHDREHVARVRRDDRAVPDRRGDARVPAADGPLRRAGRARRGYAKEQSLWRQPGVVPVFDETLELDLASVEPSVAGPRRPQDRVALDALRDSFRADFPPPDAAAMVTPIVGHGPRDGHEAQVSTGSVAIAAITSCTNTSNPTVMVGAGLLARNAVEQGPPLGPTVKTSARARVAGRHPLPRRARAHPRSRRSASRRRVRLHDVHRQLRTARRAGRRGHRRERPRRRGGPLGQPQLRGPHPSPGPGVLPRPRRRSSSPSRSRGGSTSI